MKIAYVGPISLRHLSGKLEHADTLPMGYQYPFGASLCLEYLRKGHEVLVVTSVIGAQQTQVWQGAGLTVVATPRRKHYLFCFDAYRKERTHMVAALREHQPDVLHAQWNYEFAHAAIGSGFPALVTVRDSISAILRTTRTPYRLYRYFYGLSVMRRCRNLSTISEYMRREITRQGIPSEAIAVIPNGLPEERFHPPRPSRGHGPFTVLAISGWGKRKNILCTLQAFALFHRKHPQSRLILIGQGLGEGGKAWRYCHNRACAEGIEFRGPQAYDRTLESLREEADLFVHTTLEESFGMSILEAMANGKAIIAGKESGAVPWLLAENAGCLTDITHADAVASAMEDLHDHPERRALLAENAYDRAQKFFAMEKVVDAYLATLESLC